MDWFKVYPIELLQAARRHGLTLEATGFLLQIAAVLALHDGHIELADLRQELRPVPSPKKFASLKEACGPLFDAYVLDVQHQIDAYLAKTRMASRSARLRWGTRASHQSDRDANVPAIASANATAIAHTEKSRRDQHPSAPKGEQLDQSFERFWQAYPKKVNKSRAFSAWARLRPDDALLSQILEALAWQRELPQWTKEHGTYVPHASTWLNCQDRV